MSASDIDLDLKRVTVLTGPTAGGKSALALALAARVGGVIINADASQLYDCLRVVTARPRAGDEAAVPHRLYGVLAGDDMCTAARWADMAKTEIAAARAAGLQPIIVGGTGLYLAALMHGLAPVPDIGADVRAAVRALPTDVARAALEQEDPASAARLMPADRQRMLRALEVVRSTGRPLGHWQQQRAGGLGAAAVQGLVVDRPRAELHARAATRLQAMLAEGALDEVAALLALGLPADAPVLKALAVPQLAAHLAGLCSLDDAMAQALFATRQYQKRQSTWARGQVSGWLRVVPTPDGVVVA
ncbi:tRNA (adenosine(37)-N6)-dimethylallyltransferase MiaA [Sandarakinorhabdus sp.]|uniref:tRNA (adenosine(37)-N6)-dimethylallyltransferase MiaA n=1 Tax=Sandarakinorhabdus sp. TaxID=1916663 RepID=UPI003F6F050C